MSDNVVLHIVLVGFHHKKGCQVEFSYPPLIQGADSDSSQLPEEWKYLPFLALPDGAHNFSEDNTFFHLPPRAEYKSQTTVFAVSCYRQIATNLLKNKDIDVTRGTVQKSVVVLTQEPVFGLLLVKLKMITQAYFEEKDFSKKEILIEVYNHINLSICKDKITNKSFGLSAQSLISQFHHKIVMLFKLMLLEKRVLFYATPVNKLVEGIMALLSLFPDMIENGLKYCTVKSKPEKASVTTDQDSENVDLDEKIKEISKEQVIDDSIDQNNIKNDEDIESNHVESSEGYLLSSLDDDNQMDSLPSNSGISNIASTLSSKFGSLSAALTSTFANTDDLNISIFFSQQDLEDDNTEDEASRISFENSRLELKSDSPAKPSFNKKKSTPIDSITDPSFNIPKPIIDFPEQRLHEALNHNQLGFPLSIFTEGYLCLPYICLQQYDELTSNYSRGFVAGASNMLFTTQQNLVDVVVDMDSNELIIRDPTLKRALHLSAADLRFADFLVANVKDDIEDDEAKLMSSTNWEGGDEWIQAQFANYLTAMIAVSLPREGGSKDVQDFNEIFMKIWRNTNNYHCWLQGKHTEIYNIKPSHPFQAQYTMNDMKLRLHHNLHGSEKGRKIEDVMNNANQAVVNSGKAVGSAFVSAKSAFSSWLSEKKNR